MDFTKEQQKSLKEGFCRERIRKALSTERPAKVRVSRVSWEEMNIISPVKPKVATGRVIQAAPKIYYVRITSQGATPITKEKYLWESECAPASWCYAWGTKREILELCSRQNIAIKGELI